MSIFCKPHEQLDTYTSGTQRGGGDKAVSPKNTIGRGKSSEEVSCTIRSKLSINVVTVTFGSAQGGGGHKIAFFNLTCTGCSPCRGKLSAGEPVHRLVHYQAVWHEHPLV